VTTTVKDAAIEKANGPTVETTIAQLIERQKGAIGRALPGSMNPDRFARILVTECKANPQLMRCEPMSMLAAVMRAAQLGLEPGPLGHVYLVPFRNGKTGRTDVQFILGYKGIVTLARRSGSIKDLYAEVVYDGDDFDYELGLHRDLRHRRTERSDRTKVTHAYAVAHFVEGGAVFEVLDRHEIDGRRGRSKASASGPWVSDFDAMAKKSAVRALAKWLPLTIEADQAVNSEERVFDLSDFGDVIDVTEEPETAAIEAAEVVEAEVAQ
jgi:recombination protein RecT